MDGKQQVLGIGHGPRSRHQVLISMAKQVNVPKPSEHLPKILSALAARPGMDTGEVATVLNLSPSRTREILGQEIKRGTIKRKEIVDDDGAFFAYYPVHDVNEMNDDELETVANGTEPNPKDSDEEEEDFAIDREFDELMASADEIVEREMVIGAPSNSDQDGMHTPREASRPKSARKSRGTANGRGNPDAKKAINPQKTLEDKKRIAKELGGSLTWANRKWVLKGKDFETTLTSREIATFTLDDFRNKLGG